MDELLTIEDLATALKVHPDTVRTWVAARTVPFTTLAGTTRIIRFTAAHVAAIIAMGEHVPVPAPSPLRLVAGGVR